MNSYLVAYGELIASDRVSQGTRDALLTRARPDSATYEPIVLSPPQLDVLRATLDRLVPQSGSAHIDLAARIDSTLGTGVGDGWRRAELPPDAVAYRSGLETLAEDARRLYAAEFLHLDGVRQDVLLRRILQGHFETTDPGSSGLDRLNATQMQAWFYDLLADAVKLFVAHPQTLAGMGYSGIANGGDGSPKRGFEQVGVDAREPWEPAAPSTVYP